MLNLKVEVELDSSRSSSLAPPKRATSIRTGEQNRTTCQSHLSPPRLPHTPPPPPRCGSPPQELQERRSRRCHSGGTAAWTGSGLAHRVWAEPEIKTKQLLKSETLHQLLLLPAPTVVLQNQNLTRSILRADKTLWYQRWARPKTWSCYRTKTWVLIRLDFWVLV